MSINLTDELLAKTKKGKIASAKQVFLNGDQENLQQIGEKTHQLEDAIKDITVSGGASTANAVSYNNETSGMTAITAQGAIDELAAKNKAQDATIGTKAEKSEVATELDKKFDKENIAQEFGDSKEKVVSQFALPFREIESPEFIHCIVDANDHLLFTINLDGEVDWSKGIPTPIKAKFQEIINQCQQDKRDLLESINTLKGILDKTTIKDEEGIVVETPFRYIQNEEFIFAKVDANDKLLFGFQWDGTPVFGKTSAVEDRLQSQVSILADKITTILGDDDTTSAIDTLKELKDFFASIDNTQTLTSILANLNSVSTKLGEDIKNLQDTKVDKEEGKSLIEDEVKECFRIIENEEFLKAIVDSDDKVLFGFYRATGKPYYPLNEMYHVIQNEEYFAAWVTTDDKVVLGLRRDGQIIGEIHAVNALKQVISQLQLNLASLQEKVGTIDNNLKELLDVFSLQENPEYMAVEKDADDKVLSATYNDGSHYIHNAKSETIPTEFEHIEDPEGRSEITIDAESKLLGYRDSKGIRYEQSMQIDHFYKNGREINYATEDYVNNKPLDEDKIHISKLEGVKDYSYPNLFNSRSIQKYDSAFADKVYEAIGRKTGETGCYSNFIDCKEGDWFTRNDFGTGIVVVCDGKRNIIGDVKDVAYKPTFQIKASEGQDFSEVRYVVMVVMLANINSQRIVKAKYITDRTEDTLRIPKLRIGQDNLEMGVVPYIKATSGNFYSLSIDDSTSPQIVLDKLDGIPASELPNDFPKFSFSGDFSEYLDSLVMCPIEGGETYLFELGKNGLVKRYLNKKVNCARVIKESSTAYIYGCDGGLNTSSGRLNIFRANNHTFDVVKSNIISSDGQLLEPHDCLVLSVSPLHVITQSYIPNQTTVVDGVSKKITSLHIEEQYEGKRIWIWKSEAHPDLWKDSHDQADNADYLHNNTICLTTEGNVLLNNKHANQILILERTWNESSHTGTIGDILYKVGGDHNKVSYDVSNRIKTTEEQQWFESHDAEMREDGSITMFDNEPSYPSRILDFKIDTINKCLKDFKSYSFEKYHGRYMGSAQKLADGVYLVSWGSVRDGGTPNLGIYDFNKNKKIFELKFDALAYSTYRVYGITV
jgi:hypothetical protein